jgi:hypothetical protein
MTKKKTAAPQRAKARAVESKNRGGLAPKPAATSLQRDLESARTRTQARRFNKNLTVAASPTPKHAIKVQATQTGYYDHIRRRPGDVFLIDGERLEADVLGPDGKTVTRKKGEVAAFSSRWMEKVDASTPESVSTANDAIRQQHDELLASRYADGLQVGPDNVNADEIEDDGGNPLGE